MQITEKGACVNKDIGGEETSEVADRAECSTSATRSCVTGNCLTLQVAESCCKSVDTLSIFFSVIVQSSETEVASWVVEVAQVSGELKKVGISLFP